LIISVLTSCTGRIDKNLNLAYQAEEQENYQLAIKYLDKVLKINPNHLIALNNRGWDKFDLGDTIGALNDFNTIILLDTTCDKGYYNRGKILFEKKQYSEALLDFNKVLKIKGVTETDSGYNIPNRVISSFVDNPFFGIHAADTPQKLETNLDWLFFNRGCTNYYLNNYKSASKDFSYCIYMNNDFVADAYYWRAYVYYNMGNSELACKNLVQAAGKGCKVLNKEYEIICNKQ
jgi:tetratricopeptide (TPR) repeat protein